MNKQSKIIIIVMFLLFTLVNIIEFDKIPTILIILASVVSSILLIGGVIRDNYFKKNSIYFSLFFILILISMFLFILDIILKGTLQQYSNIMSDFIYLVMTIFFFMAIVLGFIGVIKKNKK